MTAFNLFNETFILGQGTGKEQTKEQGTNKTQNLVQLNRFKNHNKHFNYPAAGNLARQTASSSSFKVVHFPGRSLSIMPE